MGKSAFLLISAGAGLGILILGLGLLVFLMLGSRRARRPMPTFLLVVGIVGVTLMEAAAAASALTYTPFDPTKSALHLSCRRIGPAVSDDPAEIRFDYDPARQCQNHTFYEARPDGLERVVTQSFRQDAKRVYEASALRFSPDFAEPSRKGVFSKTRRVLDSDAFNALLAAKGDGALTCPDANDAEDHTQATTRSAALRTRWAALPAAGQTVTRWRCSAATP